MNKLMSRQFNERINISKAKLILDNYDHLAPELFGEQPDLKKYKKNKTILAKVITKCRNGQLQTKYVFGKDHTSGRLYAEGGVGLQGLKTKIRNTIADEYYDVDIVNCFPTLLANYCVEHCYPCTELLKYNTNRNTYRADYSFDVKLVMNSMINNGFTEYDSVSPKPEWLILLKNEIVSIHNLIKTDNPVQLKQQKNRDNKLGSLMFFILSNIESEILNIIVQFIQSKLNIDIIQAVLMFDGLMMLKELFTEEHLLKLNDFVGSVHPNVSLVFKNMDTLDLTDLEPGEAADDFSCARNLHTHLESLNHRFVKCGGKIYWYEPDEGIWYESLEKIRTFINKCPTISLKYRTMTSKQNGMLVQFESCMVETDNQFLKQVQATTYRKVPFQNGIYDFESGKLVAYCADYIFFSKLKIDYTPDNTDKDLRTEVYQKFFLDVFGEATSPYYLQVLARALAGEIQDKQFIIIPGEGNSGKGSNSELLMKTFEHLVGNTNIANLACKTHAATDSSKELSWIVPLRNCRFAISNEAKMNHNLDGNIINSVSGGDVITARQNYQDEQEYIPQCTFLCFLNDIPKITPMDDACKNRVKVIDTKYSYLDGAKYEQKKHLSSTRRADPDLKNVFVKRPDVHAAFAHLVVSSYCKDKPVEPPEVVDETQNWTECDDLDALVSRLFVDSIDDSVSCDKFYKQAKAEGITASKQKVGRIMTKLGYKSQTKTKNCKPIRVYQGIRLLKYDEKNEDDNL